MLSLFVPFVYTTLFILFLNLLVYWIQNKSLTSEIKYFTLYLGLSFLTQVFSQCLAENSITNLPLLHLYTPLEFLFLSFFYKKVLKNESWFQKWINYIIGVGLLLIIANSVFLQPIFSFNSNAKTLSQVLIMIYPISYYFSVLHKRTPSTPLLNLLNAAILLYYAGSFFIFMFSNVLLKNLSTETQRLFWFFNALLYLIFQLLVLFAGWRKIYYTTKSLR